MLCLARVKSRDLVSYLPGIPTYIVRKETYIILKVKGFQILNQNTGSKAQAIQRDCLGLGRPKRRNLAVKWIS